MTTGSRPLRWGIIGTGGIARHFAGDLAGLPDATLTAVGSRSQESASAFAAGFARTFPGVRPHGSWAGLVADPEVDVVYVATPHPWHAAAALLAIEAGRHVLVEKPFTMDAEQARSVVRAARAARVFCMEAMWTRFLPHVRRIRAMIAEGAIGDVVTVSADHGQWFAPDPHHRLFDPALGGGALLDLGIYPVSWASMLLGRPSAVHAVSEPAVTGVDAQTSVVLRHPTAAQAVLTCTLASATPRRSFIAGTEGAIDVEPTFYAPTSFTMTRRDGESERFESRPEVSAGPGKGLRFEADEVAERIRAGELESPDMPLDETISIMETMDEIRRQIGLSYPQPGAATG
jgi:predicted dehydrogenase